jgi:hypothetical protein
MESESILSRVLYAFPVSECDPKRQAPVQADFSVSPTRGPPITEVKFWFLAMASSPCHVYSASALLSSSVSLGFHTGSYSHYLAFLVRRLTRFYLFFRVYALQFKAIRFPLIGSTRTHPPAGQDVVKCCVLRISVSPTASPLR